MTKKALVVKALILLSTLFARAFIFYLNINIFLYNTLHDIDRKDNYDTHKMPYVVIF